MKYLILGSEGQIGKPLKNYLKSKGHKIFEMDIINSTEEDLRINNNPLLDRYIEQSDFIFFLAFDVGGSKYLKKFEYTYEFINNNILIMKEVFEKIKKYSKPFIFASSQMSLMNWSSYGVLKKVGENYTHSLNGLTVKFWNVYGYEKNLDKSHVITDFILNAKKFKKIKMLTNGKEMRQFLHVEDCCECLYEISKKYNELSKKEEYHITSFEWTSIYDVAKIVSTNFENVSVYRSRNKDTIQNKTKFEPNRYVLSFWKPKFSLESGIKNIIMEMDND